MNATHKAAKEYLAAGLGVLPIRTDGSKAPALNKDHNYFERLANDAELTQWFGSKLCGIGLVNGAVSGNLETLDFERWSDFEQWQLMVDELSPGLVDQCNICETPGRYGQAGAHVRYRHEGKTQGSQKLASDYKLDAGGKIAKDKKGKDVDFCIIETRGEHSYALAPGSPRTCHKSGREWQSVDGADLFALEPISAEERGILLSCARSMNAVPPEADAAKETASAAGSFGVLRPGDDYNARGPDWADILEPHGWKVASSSGQVRRWRRPDKGEGWSATTGLCKGEGGIELLYVFSSNASPFEPGRAYSKFRAFALLDHKGDLAAAARQLGKGGFGDQGASTAGRDKKGSGVASPKQQQAVELLAQLQRPDAAKVWQMDKLLDTPFPPTKWIVDGLVPDEGLTFLGGRKKLGKSWLCLQIAQGVAAGAPVLGKSVHAGNVVYIVLEDGERRVKDRCIKQHMVRGLPILLYTRMPPLDTPEGVCEFVQVLEKKPRLVMLDTLAACKTGKTDENAAGPMADLANMLRRLAQHFHVGVLVTHHHGKAVHGDPGDDMRGSSAIAAAGDVNMGLYADGGRRARLKGEGRDIEPFDLSLEFDPKHTWCWQLLGDGREIAKSEADAEVISALGRIGQGDAGIVAELVGKDRRTVAERLHRLAQEGKIIAFEGEGGRPGRPRVIFALKGDSFGG